MKQLILPFAKTLTTALMLTFVSSVSFASTEGTLEPPKHYWKQDGIFGTYDRGALQRGFQVYKEVCSTCHSMNQMHYRNLTDLGYTEAQVKAIAAQYQVMDGPNDEGEMFERPAIPADKFAAPFKNEKQARAANNGALPPDLSLIVRAREGGADYVHGILVGYAEPPEGVTVADGMHYNIYFPGHQIAMPQMLMDNSVSYADGTPATLEQESSDVVAFLAWASDPNMEARKQMGIKTIIFLAIFAIMMYFVKKKIWKDVE